MEAWRCGHRSQHPGSACHGARRHGAGQSDQVLGAAAVDAGGDRGVVPAVHPRAGAVVGGRPGRLPAAAALRGRHPHLGDRLPGEPPIHRATVGAAGGRHRPRRRPDHLADPAGELSRWPSRWAPWSRRRMPSPPPRSPAGSACRGGWSPSWRANPWSTTRPRSPACGWRSWPSAARSRRRRRRVGFLVAAVGGAAVGLARGAARRPHPEADHPAGLRHGDLADGAVGGLPAGRGARRRRLPRLGRHRGGDRGPDPRATSRR